MKNVYIKSLIQLLRWILIFSATIMVIILGAWLLKWLVQDAVRVVYFISIVIFIGLYLIILIENIEDRNNKPL